MNTSLNRTTCPEGICGGGGGMTGGEAICTAARTSVLWRGSASARRASPSSVGGGSTTSLEFGCSAGARRARVSCADFAEWEIFRTFNGLSAIAVGWTVLFWSTSASGVKLRSLKRRAYSRISQQAKIVSSLPSWIFGTICEITACLRCAVPTFFTLNRSVDSTNTPFLAFSRAWAQSLFNDNKLTIVSASFWKWLSISWQKFVSWPKRFTS